MQYSETYMPPADYSFAASQALWDGSCASAIVPVRARLWPQLSHLEVTRVEIFLLYLYT